MTTHRIVNLFFSLSNVTKSTSGRAVRRRCMALAAALAVTVLVLSGATAVAQPTFSRTQALNGYPGGLVSFSIASTFNDAGTNPRFTAAVFSTTDYFSSTSIVNDRVFMQLKTNAELNQGNRPNISGDRRGLIGIVFPEIPVDSSGRDK